MGNAGCCVATRCKTESEEGEEDLAPVLGTFSQQWDVDVRGVRDERSVRRSLEWEWSIVEDSIDPAEFQRLRAFRDAVQDMDNHPACQPRPLHKQGQTLLRFLRGREGNIAKAEVMFRASMDWRRQFDVDNKICAWRDELQAGVTRRAKLVRAYGTDAEVCLDEAGLPVWLMRIGVSDPAGMLREIGQEALLINSLYRMEEMHANLRRAMFRNGKLTRGCVQILDVGDYGQRGWLARMMDGYKAGKPAFAIFDANYPETTRKVFILRMGRVTTRIYRWLLPMIPPRTRNKMRIFGPNAADWVEEMLAELPRGAALPKFLLCDSPDAFIEARPRGGQVPVGGSVPEDLLQEWSHHFERSAARRRTEEPTPRSPSPSPSHRSKCGGVPLRLLAAALVVAAAASAATAVSALDRWTGQGAA